MTDQDTAQAQPKNGVGADGMLHGAVAEGVRLGYSVIQEQIRQGQRLAQQITGGRNGGLGMGTGAAQDMAHLAQRMLHCSTDLGAMLVDLTGMLWRSVPATDTRTTPAGAAETPTSTHNGATAVTVEVDARRPTKVTLDLKLGTDPTKVATPGLYSLGGDANPLTEISFELGEGGAPELRVKIPPDQPAGTYSGVIVDVHTQEPRGTLSVRLSD